MFCYVVYASCDWQVDLRPVARESQEAGFTQPRYHSFAQPCICSVSVYLTHLKVCLMHMNVTVTSLTAKLKVFDAEDEVLPEIVPPLPGLVDPRMYRGRSCRGGRGHIWQLRICTSNSCLLLTIWNVL